MSTATHDDVNEMRGWNARRDKFVLGDAAGHQGEAIYQRRPDATVLKLTEMSYPGGVRAFLDASPEERAQMETAP